MKAIKKILFPTDFSECAEHAYTHAKHLASLFNAELNVLHINTPSDEEYPLLKKLWAEIDEIIVNKETVIDRLQRTVDTEDRKEIIVETDVSGASACDAITTFVDENAIDLVVMGTHGRRGPGRLVLGSTTDCVLRKVSCPVVTLRKRGEALDIAKPAHFIVPVDFSRYALETVQYASKLAKVWNARITLVHVIESMVIPTAYGIDPITLPPINVLIEKSDDELQKIRHELTDASLDVGMQTLIGHPSHLIADFAKERDADLILMSTRGLSGFQRFMMGSVAESVVRMAPCAVWTLKIQHESRKDEPIEDEAAHLV
ncbi:MAG: universal stress protein [Rhodothermales bacterium]